MNTDELLRHLASPGCCPQPAGAVQIVQTHLSIVCLCGDRVYKLKKPLRLPFVDFSTLARRRAVCRDEVRLNRRLCPDVYLGTASLRREGAGLRFAEIGDDDSAADVDVAVVMRRLPADRMLDVLLARGAVSTAEIEALAEQVAAFHARAECGPAVAAAGAPEKLARFARDNFVELAAQRGHGLAADLLRRLADASAADFAALLPALVRRAAAGRVRDGHGDLHARNICMTSPPTIYDCLEFAAEFRCGDVATENAFLAMDLRHRGANDLAAAYVQAYVRASGDTELPALLPPLIAYRAMVRAKVAAIAAGESELAAADRDAARRSANEHLLLAAACTIEARACSWLVLCGPPAGGKSHLAAALAAATGWPHRNTDEVRKQLAGVPVDRPARPEHYTPEFSARTYAALLQDAAALSREGHRVVLLDGNFASVARRDEARAAAAGVGATPCFVHVDVDEATALARAAARQRTSGSVSDAGPEQARALRRDFVAPTPAEGSPVTRLDGTVAANELVAQLLAWLLPLLPAPQAPPEPIT